MQPTEHCQKTNFGASLFLGGVGVAFFFIFEYFLGSNNKLAYISLFLCGWFLRGCCVPIEQNKFFDKIKNHFETKFTKEVVKQTAQAMTKSLESYLEQLKKEDKAKKIVFSVNGEPISIDKV